MEENVYLCSLNSSNTTDGNLNRQSKDYCKSEIWKCINCSSFMKLLANAHFANDSNNRACQLKCSAVTFLSVTMHFISAMRKFPWKSILKLFDNAG
ncbi:hypothetical protein RCL_jg24677.t1 [Rhizophagus clarus]|uniref:Uncharacterized protein n=1 Tax=Rhizophagus clarus TaxID=94130 RepID=A0A8H3M5S5_9GLOM|nr:hypothetical protein RCL_jg24677.t1 [Rhizophagus clarus]